MSKKISESKLELKKRLTILVEYLISNGFVASKNQIAKELKASYTNLENWLSLDNNVAPSSEKLVRLFEVFDFINTDWFFRGVGEINKNNISITKEEKLMQRIEVLEKEKNEAQSRWIKALTDIQELSKKFLGKGSSQSE